MKVPDQKRAKHAERIILDAFQQSSSFDDERFLGAYMSLLELANLKVIAQRELEKVVDGCFIKITSLESWFFVGDGAAPMGAKRLPSDSENYSAIIDITKADRIECPADRYSEPDVKKTVAHIVTGSHYLLLRASEAMQNMAKTGEKAIWTVKIVQEDGSLDRENLKRFGNNIFRKNIDFFDQYVAEILPFAFLSHMEGGPLQALGRICREERGFIKCNDGSAETIESQGRIAEMVVNGHFYMIDGLAAIMLVEGGLLEKVIVECSNIVISMSVVRLLRAEALNIESSTSSPGRGAFVGDDFQFMPKDLEAENKFLLKLRSAADFLDDLPSKRTTRIYPDSKDEFGWEGLLSSHFVDPLSYAQAEGAVLLSDDYYLKEVFALSNGKEAPAGCSSISLIRALAESGKIEWRDYYKFAGVLAAYRFRLIPLALDDLVRVVFLPRGNGIVSLESQNLEILNLPMLLSEEYGVDQNVLTRILSLFFLEMIGDDSVTVEGANEIFSITIVRTLSKRNRNLVGDAVMQVCRGILAQKLYVSRWALKKLADLEKQVAKFQIGFDPLIEAVPILLKVKE